MKVFVSSTYDDLAVHRAHVIDALRRCELNYTAMESFGAEPISALSYCLEKVQESDVFLCILGTRYGTRPQRNHRSFVELEIERAFVSNKEVRAYFLDEGKQSVLREHIDYGDEGECLAKLKRQVEERVMPCYFTTPQDLATKVVTDLFRKLAINPPANAIRDPVAPSYREVVYDDIAKWYDHWYKDHWRSKEPCDTICGIVAQHSDSDNLNVCALDVLDTACGTGNTYAAFRRMGVKIFGCDGSREMLQVAVENCESESISTEGIIRERVNWTDTEAYARHLGRKKFDLILNTANSFCHIPPVPTYMDQALENFRDMLKPRGLLIIDTKRYIQEGYLEGLPLFKELRFEPPNWVVRTTREEISSVDEIGDVSFHTRLHYDVDPSFSEGVLRALIVLTISGENITPQIAPIPYYPLPVEMLARRMAAAGLAPTIYRAGEGLAAKWRYDFVVGQRR